MRHDTRKSFMVHGATYRKAMEAERQKAAPADTLTDVIAAIAVFAFLCGAGFWITVVLA